MWIAVFGLAGIFSRYGIDQLFLRTGFQFPVSTGLINILGSAFAGCVFVLGEKYQINPSLQTGLLVGFCGGFTTFSAYTLQSYLMIEKGEFLAGMGYFVLSPLMGLIGAGLAILLTRQLLA